MAKSLLSFSILYLFLLILFLNSGEVLRCANGQAPGQGSWCVPKPSTSDQALMDNINFACGIVNCSTIQEGGPCFNPSTLINHASVAMNIYYQQEGRHFWNCDFTESGLIVVTDPSKQFFSELKIL
ncbi:unnamed protein product [Ilex paraguariensis]|uniref:X8 domain-containing protein n=1 Tax=Ilex paraguariensis TaxID=185542 RepID=A0ABC8R2K8_9AQUA